MSTIGAQCFCRGMIAAVLLLSTSMYAACGLPLYISCRSGELILRLVLSVRSGRCVVPAPTSLRLESGLGVLKNAAALSNDSILPSVNVPCVQLVSLVQAPTLIYKKSWAFNTTIQSSNHYVTPMSAVACLSLDAWLRLTFKPLLCMSGQHTFGRAICSRPL